MHKLVPSQHNPKTTVGPACQLGINHKLPSPKPFYRWPKHPQSFKLLNSPAPTHLVPKLSPEDLNLSQSTLTQHLSLDLLNTDVISSHHVRYHARDERCTLCNAAFNTPKDLRRHMNSVHSDNDRKRYYCTVNGCKYSGSVPEPIGFTRQDAWRRHLRDRHKLVV